MSHDAEGLTFTVSIDPSITQAPLEDAIADVQMAFENAMQSAWIQLADKQPAWAHHNLMPRSRLAATTALMITLKELGYHILSEKPDQDLWVIEAAQNVNDPIVGGGFCRLTALAVVATQAHARYERMRNIGVVERR